MEWAGHFLSLHVHCPCGSVLANSLCSSLAHTGSTPASLNPQPSPFPLEQSQPGTIPGFWHHGFVGNVGNHPHHNIHKSELGIAIPCSARGRNGSQKRGPDPIGRVGLTVCIWAHPRKAAIPVLPDIMHEC